MHQLYFWISKGELQYISYTERALNFLVLRTTELEDPTISKVAYKLNCIILLFMLQHLIGFVGEWGEGNTKLAGGGGCFVFLVWGL